MNTKLLALLAGCFLVVHVVHAALPLRSMTAKELAQGYRDDRILAKPLSSRRIQADVAETRDGIRVRKKYVQLGDVRVLELGGGDSVARAIARLRATGNYEYVEADVVRTPHVLPSDPSFGEQWALRNTTQNGGKAGADIGATAAWDVLTDASNVIVAVADTGIRLTHVDLAVNLWSSSTGTHGINALLSTGSSGYTNPNDDSSVGHGTHVAGVIGAVGNNGIGMTGIAWKTKLMALKFLPAEGSGSASDSLECIDFAIANHASIINASFGGAGYSSAEFEAFARARDAGIIVVASAGNDIANCDVTPDYPAGFALDNIVAVAATNSNDALDAAYSNYGSGSVDLAAPGTEIYSTVSSSDSAYRSLSGTSMSAPHVSGALALMKAKFPNDTYRQLINRLLRTTTKLPSLSGKVQSGGRLNLAQALSSTANDARPFNDDFAARAILAGANVRVRSSNAGATAETEPSHAGVSASHSLWWSWTATESTQVFFDTAGSSYDTVLAVYTGSAVNGLTTVDSDDDNEAALTSRVTLNVTAGTTYQIAVDGKSGASGYTSLRIGAVPANDNFASAKTLTGSNVRENGTTLNASRESGEPNPTGNAAGHSIWYKWTAPATATYSLASFATSTNTVAVVYTGASVSSLTTIASNDNNQNSVNTDALASFSATAGITYYFQLDHASESSDPDGGDFILTLTDSIWEYPTLDEVTSSPAVAGDGTVYFGVGAGADTANDTKVYAVTSAGTLKWTFTTATSSLGVVGASPAIGSDGTVYIGSSDKSLYALNGSTGAKKWSFLASSGISSTPAIASDGTIYFRDDTKLYALTAAGTQKWSFTLNSTSAEGTYSSPVIGTDGTVYIGTNAGALYALSDNGTSATRKWTYTAEGDIYTSPAIAADGTLYFGTLSGSFHAITPGTTSATKKWSITLPKFNGADNSISSSPAIGPDGTVYFAAYDHKLYALKPATGETKWTYTLGNEVRASSPAVASDGTVYVGVYDGSLYAVNSDGTLQRTFPSALPVRSSPVLTGNRLYFGSADAKLHAFNIGKGPATTAWPMFHQNPSRTGRADATSVSISAQPQSRNVLAGAAFTLEVTATSGAPISYQWYKDNVAISGATSSSYSVAGASASDAGSYTVVVTTSGGSVTSSPAQVTLVTSNAGRLANLSVRANAGAGDQTLIAGFVVAGSGEKDLLIRGVGPTLLSYGVGQAVPDPRVIVYKDNGGASPTELGTNDDWNSSLTSTFASVGAVSLVAGGKDAALITTVSAGAHSAHVRTDAAGIALAEIYDTNTQGGPRLINISGRAPISGNDGALIAGFVITGEADKTLLIRGIGPKLATVGVTGALSNPKLQVFRNGQTAAAYTNDDWESGNNVGTLNATFTTVGAFTLDAGSKDAALLITLPPGVYSAQVTGINGATGVALVEVYEVP